MNPYCGSCKVRMRVTVSGVYLLLGDTLRQADEYACLKCGQTVLSAFAPEPIARGKEAESWIERIKAVSPHKLRVPSASKGASTAPRS